MGVMATSELKRYKVGNSTKRWVRRIHISSLSPSLPCIRYPYFLDAFERVRVPACMSKHARFAVLFLLFLSFVFPIAFRSSTDLISPCFRVALPTPPRPRGATRPLWWCLQERFLASYPARQVASIDLDGTVYAVSAFYLCAKKLKVSDHCDRGNGQWATLSAKDCLVKC